MLREPFLTACLVFALTLLIHPAFADDVLGIPLKPDPPFAIDGDLDDWTTVPHAIEVTTQEHVIYGPAAWESAEDLSGVVHLAWRYDSLFVAVEVVDNNVRQTQRGSGMWKGDHIEVYLDVLPDLEPARQKYGEGQFQLGFSPGNFLNTGDPLSDCQPEAYMYKPERGALEGAAVASTRTANGWTLEAAVPWSALGVERGQPGMPIGIEVAISDTDGEEAQQESMMALSTETWGHTRSRLTVAALAGSDGVAKPRPTSVPVFDAVTLEGNQQQAFTFDAPAIPEGRDAVLALKARLHSSKVAGFHQGMRLTLNGEALTPDRLLNRPLRVKARDGRVFTMAAGDRFSTYYTPDFEKPNLHPQYGLLGGVIPCFFEFDVSDLLTEGANELVVIRAAAESVDNPLIVAEGRIEFRMPPPPEKEKAGPPTGELDVIAPRAKLMTPYNAQQGENGTIEVQCGGDTFTVACQYSTPAGEWATGTCSYFKLARKFDPGAETIVVRDTFTNLTGENLPVMRRCQVDLGDRLKQVWLAGLEQPSGNGSSSDCANPSTYATTEHGGIGFLALDDVSRLHVTNFAFSGTVGIADNSLVIPPNASYTAEWAIVPTDQPDYWRFLNTARRLVNANFTIDGAFAFLRQGPLTDDWSDDQIRDFLTFKSAYYVCSSIGYPRYKGRYSHGTAFQLISHDAYKKSFARWRPLYPEGKFIIYFHCFLDVTDEAPERWPDSRTLRPDGTQADYGKPHQRLFFPTETNGYGAAIAKNVDIILDDIGADGVYWDEHEYSRAQYHYGDPWDGCSGDIDPKTMQIKRLKSSVTLLSESWRVKLAKYIQSRGPLTGNGAPRTKAMAALEFPCFAETGSITNCTRVHLYSPIALGDHLTERSEEDAYRTMLAALNYGCVYHWYNDLLVIPTHHHLTRYMYPITPMGLHEGYIIGKERIVTNRSGLFGWGDDADGGAKHEVHVFDDTGTEVPDFDAPTVTRDGKTYTELRIGEDWSAAIVRK